jgi:hypothetical protein
MREIKIVGTAENITFMFILGVDAIFTIITVGIKFKIGVK